MSTEISELLRSAADRAVPVIQGIGDDRLKDPTPCSEYQVQALVNHLFQVVVNFQALAARKPADFSASPDFLTDDWRARFAVEADRLVAAWASPEALEGISSGMGLPQRTVGQMALLDLTIHPWDLARAVGINYEPDAAAVESLHELVATMGPTAQKMKVFGEPHPIKPTDDRFVQLLALTGRDPNWTV